MCTTCGCGSSEVRIDAKTAEVPAAHERAAVTQPKYHHYRPGGHWHRHADGTWHSHVHGGASPHGDAAPGPLDSAHAAGMASARTIRIEEDILAKNDAIAVQNRRFFADRGVFALNLVSSPGSGKTTLLVRTIEAWSARTPVAVIEGDQQTARDAERVRAVGVPAVQINTAKGCHLDAQMVAHALTHLEIADDSVLFIENVGNLVCPAAFDLGEAHKVVILSVTEGEDKPLKYPDMFHAADLLLVNKIDLAPHVDFDVATAIAYARRVRPGLEAIVVSARTGAGFGEWLAWLERGVAAAKEQREGNIEALRRRIVELEGELARRSERA
ncbi:MAG TPA: hydrogenase nickel incorporation protein HypB [Casimicrobiaceae bacterium]|nr:hydrogenase nickel incorporation protein HypB [Casimicrobiaceae bacterium]